MLAPSGNPSMKKETTEFDDWPIEVGPKLTGGETRKVRAFIRSYRNCFAVGSRKHQNIRIGMFKCLIRICFRMTLVSSRDSVKCKWPGLSLPPGLSLCSRISGSLSFGKSLFVKESFLRILFLRILFPYSIPNNFSFSSYPYIHISFPKMRFSSGEEVRSKIGNRILSSQPIRMGQIWFDRSHRVIRGVSWEYNDMNIPDSTRKVTLRGPRGCSIPFSGVPYSEAERSSRV